MHIAVIGNIIAVIAPRRRVERQQPDGVDAKLGDIVEFGDQARKIADAVIIGIKKRFDMDLINHRIFVPKRVLRGGDGGVDVHEVLWA